MRAFYWGQRALAIAALSRRGWRFAEALDPDSEVSGSYARPARWVHIPWMELALECGYYDQSHFAKDFRAFSGLDASAYSEHVNQWQNHVALGC